MSNLLEFGGRAFIIDVDHFVTKCLLDPDGTGKNVKEQLEEIREMKDKLEARLKKKPEEGKESKESEEEDDDDYEEDLFLDFEDKGIQINTIKHDIYQSLLDVLIDPKNSDEMVDDKLGAKRLLDKTPFDFKLAFNTLISNGILKEI